MQISLINSIAPEGLQLLGENYEIGEFGNPQGIIVRSSPLDTSKYPELLAVARAGAGVNNITVDKATEQGVCVFNTPGANANAVAELVFVMLGTCVRNIHLGYDFCNTLRGISDAEINKKVEAEKARFRGVELAGKSMAVIGLGQIGVRVANGAASRRMRVTGYDPYPAMGNIHALSADVQLARSLPDAVCQADIVSLHLPLSDKTRGFVNADFLGQLKKGTILLNYARGPVVVESDVLEALNSGQLANYLNDFPSRETVAHPQVISSPHLGASTEESEEQCARMAVTELKNYLEYGTISHSVNFPTTESMLKENVACRLIMINRDIPGMIGFASQIIGEGKINIASYINESNGNIGYNIIDLEGAPSADLIGQIEANPDVIRTRTICFD